MYTIYVNNTLPPPAGACSARNLSRHFWAAYVITGIHKVFRLLTSFVLFMMADDFEKVCSFQFLENLKVEKYKSKQTGITVCFVEVPGPLVNGFFTLGRFLSIDLNHMLNIIGT